MPGAAARGNTVAEATWAEGAWTNGPPGPVVARLAGELAASTGSQESYPLNHLPLVHVGERNLFGINTKRLDKIF